MIYGLEVVGYDALHGISLQVLVGDGLVVKENAEVEDVVDDGLGGSQRLLHLRFGSFDDILVEELATV